MKKFFITLMCIVMVVCFMPTVAMAEGESGSESNLQKTIYLDAANGNNDKDGLSEQTPVKTLSKALELASNGNTIVVSGEVTDVRVPINKAVTIKAKDTNTKWKYTISLSNELSGEVVFDGITFENGGIGEYETNDYSNLDLTFQNCTFENAAGNCIYIQSPIKSLTVDKCEFKAKISENYSKQYLIWPYYAKNITITNNVFDGATNNDSTNLTRGAIHLGNGVKDGTTVVIKDNTINNFERGIQLALVEGTEHNIKIEGNKFDNIKCSDNSEKGQNDEYGIIFIHENASASAIKGLSIKDNIIGENVEHTIYSENKNDISNFNISASGNTEKTEEDETQPVNIFENVYQKSTSESGEGKDTVYAITFDAKGGTLEMDSTVTTKEGKLSRLPEPTRSGSYKFSGWYTEDGKKVTENTVFESNATVYANWIYTGSVYIPTTPTDPLKTARTEATKAVADYVNIADYEEAQQAEIKTIVDNAKKDIEAAKTADEIKAIEAAAKAELDKLETAEEMALIRTIEGTQFTARSKATTLNGKKAIRVTWNKPADLDFDGYEIYRSNERYKGYGTEPFFTTTNQKYTNNKGLKVGKTYYYKVRGFKYVNDEKVYTEYSLKAWRTVK